MARTVHMCQDLEGAVASWTPKMFRDIGKDNDMTGAQVKKYFELQIYKGKKVIPFGEPCEGFSYETGCPGHIIEHHQHKEDV